MTYDTKSTFVIALVVVALSGPALAGPIAFVPHRAAYELALDPALRSAEVGPVTGRMVMELAGSSCEGYTSTVRYVTRSASSGRMELTDSRSTTFETMDGLFRFDDQTYTNNRLRERTTGTVTRGKTNAVVKLSRPTGKTFTFHSGVAYPVEQLKAIVEAAMAGKRFLELDVYDGADGGETVYTTATVIGSQVTPGADGDVGPLADLGLAGVRSWPTTVTYYDKSSADDPPAFIISFVLYENGIGRSLKIDQGDVVLLGTLSHLELLPVSSCASN